MNHSNNKQKKLIILISERTDFIKGIIFLRVKKILFNSKGPMYKEDSNIQNIYVFNNSA